MSITTPIQYLQSISVQNFVKEQEKEMIYCDIQESLPCAFQVNFNVIPLPRCFYSKNFYRN